MPEFDTTTWFLIIAAVFVFILLIAGVMMSSNKDRDAYEDRLGRYLEEEEEQQAKDDDTSAMTEWLNRRAEKSSRGEKTKKALARADLKFKVAEYFALVVMSVIIFALVAGFLGGKNIISFGYLKNYSCSN